MNNEAESPLRIGEAALLLGVCTKTLRNWDRAGKLTPIRHPVNRYRYYRRSDLEAYLKTLIASWPDQQPLATPALPRTSV